MEIQQLKILLAKGKYSELIENIELAGSPPEFAAIKAEALRRQNKNLNNYHAEQLKCNNCGTPFQLNNPDTKILSCKSCNSINAIEKDKVSLIDYINSAPAGLWKLELGISGVVKDKAYTIVGHAVYQGVSYEWEDEDKSYDKTNWKYHEWVLSSENGELLYLIEDQEGYSFSKNYIPKTTFKATVKKSNLNFFQSEKYNDSNLNFNASHIEYASGESFRIIEKGKYSLVGLEGEFSYIPELNEQLLSFEYNNGKSIEWRTLLDETPLEVEFFNSYRVDVEKLAYIFNFQDEIKKFEKIRERRKAFFKLAIFPYATSLICIILAIFCMQTGTTIYTKDVPLSSINEDGLILQSWEFNELGNIYEITLKANMPDNTESWVGAELLDNENMPINAFEGDFWRESGYDDEGKWSESALSTSKLFKLTKAGRYSLRLFAEGNPSNMSGINDGNVKVSLVKNVLIARFFVVSAILALTLGVLLQIVNSIKSIYFIVVISILIFTILVL
jgi:ribosomal protein L37AE/L43A